MGEIIGPSDPRFIKAWLLQHDPADHPRCKYRVGQRVRMTPEWGYIDGEYHDEGVREEGTIIIADRKTAIDGLVENEYVVEVDDRFRGPGDDGLRDAYDEVIEGPIE